MRLQYSQRELQVTGANSRKIGVANRYVRDSMLFLSRNFNYYQNNDHYGNEQFSFDFVSEDEILNVIKKIKTNAAGCNNLNIRIIIKMCYYTYFKCMY